MGLWDWLRNPCKRGGGAGSSGCGPTEVEDAREVDQAVRFIQEGRTADAQALLQAVIARTPADYVTEYESGGKLHIKFWDMEEFMACVAWRNAQGQARDLVWMLNAYSRACYYLGYLRIEARDYAGAVEALDAGLQLEPDNPKLKCEKAQALIRQGQPALALALYDEVLQSTGFVSSINRALALRGRGYVLIEMDRLDEAEEAFQESQKIEPDSEVARNELAYIAQRRKRAGGEGLASELGVTQEQLDIWYRSYQFGLSASGRTGHWNDDIDALARQVGALTEDEIVRAHTDFNQAVLNRIKLRVVMDRLSDG
jgi:tetratricopeptide (TPR) repeat protein